MINQMNDDDDENIYALDTPAFAFNAMSSSSSAAAAAVVAAEDNEKLKAYIIRLKTQLDEEKSNSKQAAEYGLSLLEDSKKLQSRIYELEGEIETYKAELETTNLVSDLYILNIFICLIKKKTMKTTMTKKNHIKSLLS